MISIPRGPRGIFEEWFVLLYLNYSDIFDIYLVPFFTWIKSIWDFKSNFIEALVKFMFSKKATKNDKTFTIDLTVTSTYRQIDGEDFVNFCGLLRKREL